MSPRSSTLLALCGVLLAGIPLPALTAARSAPPLAKEEGTPEPLRPTCATLYWSGQPRELRLLHGGRELARLSEEELAASPCEMELHLPAAPLQELELTATWAEDEHTQAVSLMLEPEGLPSRQCTQWTEPGSATLHALFSFSW